MRQLPALALVNSENDLSRVENKGSSVGALSKFPNVKVPFRKKTQWIKWISVLKDHGTLASTHEPIGEFSLVLPYAWLTVLKFECFILETIHMRKKKPQELAKCLNMHAKRDGRRHSMVTHIKPLLEFILFWHLYVRLHACGGGIAFQ